MKNTITPGDWTVCRTGPGDNGFDGLTVQSDAGLVVRMPGEMVAPFDEENEANAKAIAALPTLIAAFQDIDANLGEEAFRRNDHIPQRLADSRRRIAAALAAAGVQ